MKKYEFYFWFRYGDQKDYDTKNIEAENKEVARVLFDAWIDTVAGRPIRVGLIKSSIEITEL